jgi:hypothetical protein
MFVEACFYNRRIESLQTPVISHWTSQCTVLASPKIMFYHKIWNFMLTLGCSIVGIFGNTFIFGMPKSTGNFNILIF